MKRTLLLVVVCSLSFNAFAQTRRRASIARPRSTTQPQAIRSNAQTLPIRRVILYSNGVAYIERRGAVTGHAEIDLSFKQSQVDDVTEVNGRARPGPGTHRRGQLQLERRRRRHAWPTFLFRSKPEL
jgi:hypothetical protein